MLNKLRSFVKQHDMLSSGDRVICAVSGGADSVALLFALFLLAPQMGFVLEAAHFNHGLRGEESDEDAEFVRQLCDRLEIPLHMGRGNVTAGDKGLEAAARNARYAFLESLDGKIATAHTADDNAETVLMHLIRGTALRGLGGITPVRGKVIRPMLTVTRQEVLSFLQEFNLTWREDSTNAQDDYLRNRLRHRVMPLLQQENPSIAQNLSHMALLLRQDEQMLSSLISDQEMNVTQLRQLPVSLRKRWIVAFLERNDFYEPQQAHVELVDSLICSQNPSARCDLPGGVTVSRCYDRLVVKGNDDSLPTITLQIPSRIPVPGTAFVLTVRQAASICCASDRFTVSTNGPLVVRPRKTGDSMRLSGGTKTLKKLFIDKKIPAMLRSGIPVIADDTGVLGVFGIGPNIDRLATDLPAVEICFEKIDTEE